MMLCMLWSPYAVLGWCILIFVPCRIVLGGASYLPSQAWQALCIIIPCLVVLGIASGVFCAPIQCDLATVFHVLVTLAYFQLDLGLARLMTGPLYGNINVFEMFIRELSPVPSNSSNTLAAKIKAKVKAPAFAKAPLFDFCIDLVSVTSHEIFWNVFICENCLKYGAPVWVGIVAVPLASGLVHGIVTSVPVGVRMIPQFLHVALAYHTSGSVVAPALIHQFWYLLDQKPLSVMKQAKRDWDIEERSEEVSLSCWDVYSSASLALTLCFYIPLEYIVGQYPVLRSVDACVEATHRCSRVHVPRALEIVLAVLFMLRILMLINQWEMKRFAYDQFLEGHGSGTEQRQKEIADAVGERHERQKAEKEGRLLRPIE